MYPKLASGFSSAVGMCGVFVMAKKEIRALWLALDLLSPHWHLPELND